jgi:formylglycine-generating enzyme required for sulfatase activity
VEKNYGQQPPGQRFALPTEAQWEYAARSRGKNEKYAEAVTWTAWLGIVLTAMENEE